MKITTVLLLISVLLACAQSTCLAQGGAGQPPNIVLSPADQLILKSIEKINDRLDRMNSELNGRMDQMNRELNGRIDNLWMAIVGGFIGVMGFIGALVFWDRRTFLSRAKEAMRAEMTQNRKRIDGLLAAVRTLGEQHPQVRESLRSCGLW